MNRLLALFAFAIFAGFVAILAIEVPSPDLVAVVILTLILVGYDFYTSSSDKQD
jgi:xanthosine utilization system XapX-like protein